MEVKTGVTLKPGGDFGVLVGRIVVANDVKLQLGSDFLDRSCAGRPATPDGDGAGRCGQTPCRKGSPRRQRGLPFRAGSSHGSGCECVPGPKAIRAGCVREPGTGFHEKAVKLFLKFISHFFCGGGIVLPSGLGVLVHVLIRLFAAKGGTLPSLYRSLLLEPVPQIAIVPNRPSSVKKGSRVPPERLPRRAVRGLGAHSPQQTGSSHGGKGFIRFTGFPEREEQYGELSCDGNDGPLLGLGCSLLGKT